MKAIKRTVAALLATLMLATSTSFTLAAEEYSAKEAVVVAKVNGAGIMTGTDKGFEPSKTLTRAEAAAIIVRMKGISESAVKTMAGTTLFTDVAASHWASGYINEASNLGIVKGVSAKEFAPDREVTVAEFVTMAIRALGAGTLVDSEGTWPTNYVNFANEEGLLDDVSAIYSATASRMNAATIVANSLEADMWSKTKATTNKEVTWERATGIIDGEVYNKFLLYDVLSKYIIENKTCTFDAAEKTLTIGSHDYDVAESVDMTALKAGVEYDFMYDTKDKEIVAFWAAEDAKSESYEFTEIGKNSTTSIKLAVDGKDVKLEEGKDYDVLEVYYNNSKVAATTVTLGSAAANSYTASSKTLVVNKDGDENAFGTAIISKNNSDEDVLKIYIEKYTNAGVVDEVTSTRVKFNNSIKLSKSYSVASSSLKIDADDTVYNISKDGKSIELDELEEDDVVFYYVDSLTSSDTIYNMVVVTNSVEGKITAVGEDYIKLDGEKYVVEGNFDNTDQFSKTNIKDEIIAYFNEANKIVAYDAVESTGDYAVITSLEVVNARKGLEAEVVLTYADGTSSETLTIDFEDEDSIFEGLDDIITGATTKDAAGYNTKVKANPSPSILGTLVNYELDGDKVVIKAFDDADEQIDTASTGKLTISTKSYITISDHKYYVDKNTKFVSLKANTKTKDMYKLKVSTIDFADLDTTNTVTVMLAGIDDDKNVDEVIFIETTNKVNKTSSEDKVFYYVLGKADVDDDDYKVELTVASVNGEETVSTNNESIEAAQFGVFDFSGKEALDWTDTSYYRNEFADDEKLDGETAYATSMDNGVLKLAYAIDSSDRTYTEAKYELSDEILYIAVDKDGKASIGSENKIDLVTAYSETVSTTTTYYVESDYADQTQIYGVILKDVEETSVTADQVWEVIAIVYAK